jgi:hypothetical protein
MFAIEPSDAHKRALGRLSLLVLGVLVFVGTFTVQGGAQIVFSNLIPGVVDAPIRDLDGRLLGDPTRVLTASSLLGSTWHVAFSGPPASETYSLMSVLLPAHGRELFVRLELTRFKW